LFKHAHNDILEQIHFTKSFEKFTDYTMFLELHLEPNEVSVVKIKQEESKEKPAIIYPGTQKTALSIKGFSESGEVIFDYENVAQRISQTFGVSINYYKSHVEQHYKYANLADKDIEEKYLTDV